MLPFPLSPAPYLLATARLADAGPVAVPGHLWQTWSWQPALLVGLLITGFVYGRGLRAIHSASNDWSWRATYFAAGLCVICLALASPLDALSNSLFSAHMVQHLVLMAIAAPLLILGDPAVPLLLGLPAGARRSVNLWRRGQLARRVWRLLRQPAIIWALPTATLWLWHLPNFYDAALESNFVHSFEHACFLATAMLFWWAIIQPGRRRQIGYGAAMALTCATAVQSTALGIIITVAGPLYPFYSSSTAAWHLSQVEDQQLAGLIMWIPAGAAYLAALLGLIVAWFRAEERKDQIRSRPLRASLPVKAAAQEIEVQQERAS